MAPCKSYIFLLILIFAHKSVRANKFNDIKEAASKIWEGVTGVRDIAKYLWSGVENSKILERHKPTDVINSPIADLQTEEQKLIRQHLRFLSAQGDSLLIDIHAVKDVIKEKLVQNVAGLHDLSQRIHDVSEQLNKIDQTYNSFLEYVTDGTGTYDLELLSKIAADVVQTGSCGIKTRVVKLNALLIGQDPRLGISNTIDLLLQHFGIFSQYTKVQQSQQQLLYNLLVGVLWTEIKAFLVVHWAYKILESYNGRSYASHMKKYEAEYDERNSNTFRAFKAVMQGASREYFKWDPVKHVEGKTYVQLENLFQAILLTKMDVNRTDACSNTCNHKSYRKKDYVTKCYDDDDDINLICKRQQPCEGDIVFCGYLFKNDLEVCLSKNSAKSKRRYEYLIDADGVRHGSKDKCEGEVIMAESLKYSFLKAWRKNDICTCICAEKRNSDRYFSMHVAKARYEENYVITGVRFVKKKNIIHLQVQEGQLLGGAVIDESTVRWVPLPTKVTELYAIEWSLSNAIELNDLNTHSKNQAIVAIQLKSNGKRYKHLTFEITLSDIDHRNGRAKKYSLTVVTAPRTKVRFPYSENNELPTRFIEKNTKTAGKGMHALVLLSGPSTDVAQSVVPFIDIQDVVTVPPAPLSGLGLYMRYVKNSGGFLAPKIFTYDYEYNLNADYKIVENEEDHQEKDNQEEDYQEEDHQEENYLEEDYHVPDPW